ncbi:MAG TPA: AAA family ATPase [Acidimicrobiales bacterium]|nr:AAA family ATPase [Acidimicrobiales bacterium]
MTAPMRDGPTATPTATVATSTATVATSLVDNVSAVVLGKRPEVELVVAGLLAGGHVLLEDVPGVGKTLLARSLARSLGGSMARIQGTVDLMPSDITGVHVYDPRGRSWEFHPGPVFNNVVLLDEVNRATPRSQSALLEAMSEGQVTVDGVSRPLPDPFFVIATQNPYGDVGTFPLSEGQCDRFALIVSLGLPDRQAERAVLRGDGGPTALDHLAHVVSGPELAAAVADVDRTHVDPAVADYVLDIVDATRSHPELDHGASPRAARTFLQVAKAHAVLHGRDFVAPDDVKAVAAAVLAHRLGVLSRRGTVATRRLVDDLLAGVAAPVI